MARDDILQARNSGDTTFLKCETTGELHIVVHGKDEGDDGQREAKGAHGERW